MFLGDLNVFDSLFGDILRNVLSQILNSIVVGDSDFLRNGLNLSLLSVFNLLDLLGDSFNLGLILIFHDFLFKGNVFDSALALNNLFSSVDSSSNDLSANNLLSTNLGSRATNGATDGIVATTDGVVSASNSISGLVAGGIDGLWLLGGSCVGNGLTDIAGS